MDIVKNYNRSKNGKYVGFIILILLFLSLYYSAESEELAQEQGRFSEDEIFLLARQWNPKSDPTEYLVSEKFDGVRAQWDGKNLYFRSGKIIVAPKWFLERLPKVHLDGELWMGRRRFDEVSAAVRKDIPDNEQWKEIKYMIFELPFAKGDFESRVTMIEDIVKATQWDQLVVVEQFSVDNPEELLLKLKDITAKGAEGLMLHRKNAMYMTGRADALFKYKLIYDAEATIIGYTDGKGKYEGKVGAFVVESEHGIVFKIGSGLSDNVRENPPPIGSMITYSYNGYTKNGLPRFPRYIRVYAQH